MSRSHRWYVAEATLESSHLNPTQRHLFSLYYTARQSQAL